MKVLTITPITGSVRSNRRRGVWVPCADPRCASCNERLRQEGRIEELRRRQAPTSMIDEEFFPGEEPDALSGT